MGFTKKEPELWGEPAWSSWEGSGPCIQGSAKGKGESLLLASKYNGEARTITWAIQNLVAKVPS